MHTPSRPTAAGRRTRARTRAALGCLLAAAALAGCGPASHSASPGGSPSGPGATTAPAVSPLPSIAVAARTLPFDQPAAFAVHGGRLRSAVVKGHGHGAVLPGHVDATGSSWSSDTLPVAGTRYDVTATVADAAGLPHTLHAQLAVAAVPNAQRLGYDVTPGGGMTVGTGAPIVIRFNHSVADRAAVERALTVYASRSVAGAWHWIGSSEVHFRTRKPWPAHTAVQVNIALAGVKAGPAMWGTTDTVEKFTVGDSRVTTVDGRSDTMTVTVNGGVQAVYPTSLGRPQFQTRTGTYVVLSKDPTVRMTSCSASITCDKKNPNFYDLTVLWDVRLTWSGTFIHAAPWSVAHQGHENVSHGCVNLSTAHAEAYFGTAHYGDLVTVKGTGRGPDDLLRSGDPGMADWNLSWTAYVGGSALGAGVTTMPLSAA